MVKSTVSDGDAVLGASIAVQTYGDFLNYQENPHKDSSIATVSHHMAPSTPMSVDRPRGASREKQYQNHRYEAMTANDGWI